MSQSSTGKIRETGQRGIYIKVVVDRKGGDESTEVHDETCT